MKESFEEGLNTINAFPFARPFVESSFMFGDYRLRWSQAVHIAKRIKNIISKGVITSSNGEKIAYTDILQQKSRHRGRPRNDEASNTISKEADDIAVKKMQVIAEINGATVVTKPAEKEKSNSEIEEEKKAVKENSTDLFSASAEEESTSRESNVIDQVNESKLSLSSIQWMLSEKTSEKISSIAELRGKAAAASEKAKMLAEQNAPAESIKPYSEEACKATEEYTSLYKDIDDEMAMLHIKLVKYPSQCADVISKSEERGITVDALKNTTKPYYDKVTKSNPTFESEAIKHCEENTPEAIAERKARKERKERIDSLVKYIRRTDVKSSAKRVKGLEKALAELDSLGEDSTPFRPILEKTKSEVKTTKKQ